ncbi:MAG: ABC transporter permease, partial [Firmicutes bacterium]|nr:ABC transporter permease [Bacillota bacterium]
VSSEANYRAAAELALHLPPVELEEQSASLFLWTRDGEDKPLGAASVRLGDATYDLKQVAYVNQDVCSMSVLVVPDVNYCQWVSNDDSLQFWHQLCFETPNWHKLLNVHELVARNTPPEVSWSASRADGYAELRNAAALTMFIGVFVSFLFFIASGSLLYFKLFTEIDVDKRQFTTLHDIGITRREKLQIINRELGILFFLPVAIGALHTAFAMKTLSNLAPQLQVIGGTAVVAGIYAVLQLIYFLLARRAYLKQLQS